MIKLLINVFVLLLTACSEQLPKVEEMFGNDNTIDVITWNIENFPKDNQTINYVSKIINDMNIDIIALQEIENQQDFNSLINRLSDDWVGYRASSENGWGQLAYLINKRNLEIIEPPYIILDQYEDYFAYRPPYVVQVKFDDEEFIIINVHFKCCGNGTLEDDVWDEEFRRLKSNEHLKDYIDNNFNDQKVIILGDFNDDIAEDSPNNIFMNFINDIENYYFSDMYIAEGSSSDWSFPSWPSHLDHILITNELLHPNLEVQTLKLEHYIAGGWGAYHTYISDHRPVGISLP
tara:strand:- start:4316 stop:5188 length:873 start_codon:yes stop_codon:yes gene_type:complete